MIIIEDEDIPLKINESVAITFQLFDLADFTKRVISFSSRLRFVNSEIIRLLSGFAFSEKSTSTKRFTYLDARVVQSGIDIFRNAKALINYNKGYDVELYDSTIQFYDIIKEKLITSLNFGEYIEWDASYIDSRRDASEDLVSPFIDYGTVDLSLTQFEIGDVVPPSVYYHSIVKQIIADAGYSYSGDVFNNEKFLKLIVPFSRDNFDYGISFRTNREFQASGNNLYYNHSASTVTIVWPTLDKADGYGIYNLSNGFYEGSGFVSSDGDDRAWRMDAIVEVDVRVVSGEWILALRTSEIGFGDVESQNMTAGNYTIRLAFDAESVGDGLNGFFAGNSNFNVRLENVSAGEIYINGRFYNRVYAYQQNTIPAQQSFRIEEILPDINQSDFIKDFLIRFGLVMTESNGVLDFTYIKDIINNRQFSIDWTEKRDISVDDEILHSNSFYGKINKFIYESNDDLFFDYIGLGIFQLHNDRLKAESTFYNSIFYGSSTETIVNAGAQQIFCCKIPIYESVPSNYTEPDESPGFRIAYVREKYSQEPDVEYNGISRSDYLIGYFFDGNQDNSLEWDMFINEFYSEIVSALQSYTEVRRRYNLTDIDINKLNLLTLVYDNGSYYLLLKVENYISRSSTKVYLLRLP